MGASVNYVNLAPTVNLVGGITDSATSLVVNSATGYPAAPFGIVINNEAILVGAKSGTTFSSLSRGFDGTTAAAHANDDEVKHVVLARDLYIPEWMRHLALRDDTPHADDDEFDVDGTGVPSGWTEVKPTGNTSYVKKRGLLSTKYWDQATNDLVGLMKPIASGTNVVIETAARQIGVSQNYYMHGLVFSTGTATSSTAIWLMYWNTTIELRSGTFANINVDHNSPGVAVIYQGSHIYLRLEYDSTSGFQLHFSPDGIQFEAGGYVANPLGGAPTHMGMGHTTWNAGTYAEYVAREYFRVNPS